MAPTTPGEPEPPRPGRWCQFGLGKLFLITTVVAVLAAGWAAMARLAEPSRWSLPTLLAAVALVLAAPAGLLIGVSLFRSVQRWLERRPR